VKGLFTILIIAGIIYGIYSGFMAVWSYFEISNLVEEVVPRELPQTKGWEQQDRVKKVRDAIVKGAMDSGVALDPNAVSVAEEGNALWVRIDAAYPIVRYHDLLSIPISTAHSFTLPQ